MSGGEGAVALEMRTCTVCAMYALVVLTTGCGSKLTAEQMGGVEYVMSPGTTMNATTSQGTIKIRADDAIRRTFIFDGKKLSVVMVRRRERWLGSLGLYYPEMDWAFIWPRAGIYRVTAEEGQQHFSSQAAAVRWVTRLGDMPYVYRNDGLIVGWTVRPTRHQLDVNVWRVYINGERPDTLPGGQDGAIVVSDK